ncbi:MAG: tetratricopeptide repeat protein [Pseudomonadota bacterium]
MYRIPNRRSSKTRLLTGAAVLAALMLGGCQSAQLGPTGSISQSVEQDPRREAQIWGERYSKNQKDPEAGIRYAQALRALGQRAQAVAVLEQSSLSNPNNPAVLGAYGRALADTGRFAQALDVLSRAHTPDQPDWRILSAQGAVLDQMGRHQEARQHYLSALRIAPDEPSVMSNLGLSYALSRNLPEAESTLRRANAHANREPRVRQNLALVVGLQGRFQEAQEIASADLSPEEAAANLEYLRNMLAAEKGNKGRPQPRKLQQAANNS